MVIYWVLIMGALGQIPDASLHTVAELRRSLNRFDSLDEIALDARAKDIANEIKGEQNTLRRARIESRLCSFAVNQLGVTPPFQDAEKSLIQNIADDAAKPYDIQAPPVIVKSWHVDAYGRHIYGWKDPSNPKNILFYPHEQPRPRYVQPQPQPIRCQGPACRT